MRPVDVRDGPGAIVALHRAVEAGEPFTLALIDMQMPGMDGESLGRVIKADPYLRTTHLAMMTSLMTSGALQKFEAIGFAAYLTKPLQQHELWNVLSAVLRTTPAGHRAALDSTKQQILTHHTAREVLRAPGDPGALRTERFTGVDARILLVEDNITNQKVALGILHRLGLHADAVADGAEAVHALESIPYDLVLMDVQMPVLDGLEATAIIRDPESAVLNHAIPIIAMTAEAMHGDREKCLAAGMNDYVSKPVTPRSLADRLAVWLEPAEGAL
jgi:CheY-like chemotaxis protein